MTKDTNGARKNPSNLAIATYETQSAARTTQKDIARYTQETNRLHVGRSGGTGDNLDQLTGNDGLSGTVEQDLKSVDHITGVLGGVVHGVAAGGLLAGVALGKSLRCVSHS